MNIQKPFSIEVERADGDRRLGSPHNALSRRSDCHLPHLSTSTSCSRPKHKRRRFSLSPSLNLKEIALREIPPFFPIPRHGFGGFSLSWLETHSNLMNFS
jgi:hypothetical protein